MAVAVQERLRHIEPCRCRTVSAVTSANQPAPRDNLPSSPRGLMCRGAGLGLGCTRSVHRLSAECRLSDTIDVCSGDTFSASDRLNQWDDDQRR